MPADPTPNPDSAAEHDPLVAGLLSAYAQGAFPMSEPGSDVAWYDPDPRGIIPLDDGGLKISKTLRQRVRGGRFRVTTDAAFGEVIRACAQPRGDDDGAWIDARIIDAYERLHQAGCAHSIEAWLDTDGESVLVGGLYGVHLGGLFAGESMFSRPELGGTDASKVCLVHLWHHLRARRFTLLDTQFTNDHLRRLGGIEIGREEYHRMLGIAVSCDLDWLPFSVPFV